MKSNQKVEALVQELIHALSVIDVVPWLEWEL